MVKLVPQDHPALHKKAQEVPQEWFGSTKLNEVIGGMKKALHSYDVEGYVGVAIAAPQIGESLRIFLVEDLNPSRDPEEKLPYIIAINPKIIKRSRQSEVIDEGCLSVPDHYGFVKRATHVTLEAYDEHGKKFTRGAGGLLAQIFQHECDHLDGYLFVDRAEKILDKTKMRNYHFKINDE